MGIIPFFILSTFSASISTHTTLFPVSAKQVPVTKPTYPVPITAIFMNCPEGTPSELIVSYQLILIYIFQDSVSDIFQLLFIQFGVHWK